MLDPPDAVAGPVAPAGRALGPCLGAGTTGLLAISCVLVVS